MAEDVRTVVQDDFDNLVKENPRLVVDCWAPWCGPCRMLSPIIEKLSEQYKGKVLFARLDTDSNQKIVQQCHIMAIPTLLFFRDGVQVEYCVGLVSKEAIESIMKNHF